MLRYVMQTEEVNRVLTLCNEVLDIRTTFFDIDDREVAGFDIKGWAPYCRLLRRNAAMDAACAACDAQHLHQARAAGDIVVYRCHQGLLEAVIPLHDSHGSYVGAVVCGQMRVRGARPPRATPASVRRHYTHLTVSTPDAMLRVAQLLRHISERMIEMAWLRLCRDDWPALARMHIDEHLAHSLRVSDIARAVHRSPSALTHAFRETFGLSVRQYILRRRLEHAHALLLDGAQVQEAARATGFHDAFHFSKAYRKRYGVPPVAAAHPERGVEKSGRSRKGRLV